MKLSNIITRLCYIILVLYLCYVIYQHSNNETIQEQFFDVGSSLGNLLKETALSSLSSIDYSSLINYEWGVERSNPVEEHTKVNNYDSKEIITNTTSMRIQN